MKCQKHPSVRPLVHAIVATCFLSGTFQMLHADQALQADQATRPGQYIALWDPPPFSVRGEYAAEGQGSLDATECPSFLFRNGFDSGRLVGAFRSGSELASESTGTPIRYITAAGFIVQVDQHRIWIQDPWGMNKVEHWGDPHENLNGKHIKDWAGMAGWDGTRRTILIDGGAKVTMESTGPQGLVLLTSIYDSDQNVQIDNTTNSILHHGIDSADTAARDAAQYDGETARFTVDAPTAIAVYDNVYNEDSNFTVMPFDVPLGETGGCANPNQVKDFFDDPRLAHT